MGRDGAHRLEGSLREQRADAPRILALPTSELYEVGVGKYELDGRRTRVLPRLRRRRRIDGAHAREHDAPRGQRLEPERDRLDEERASRLGDAMQKLGARVRKTRRVANFGQRDQGTRHLRRRIDALRGHDGDTEPRDE